MEPEQATGKKWHLNEVRLKLGEHLSPMLPGNLHRLQLQCFFLCKGISLSKPSADYVPTGLELCLTSLTIYAKDLQECLAGNEYLLINEVLRDGNCNQERLTENWGDRSTYEEFHL